MVNTKAKKIIAIIPARGGSERIPRKNTFPLLGIPLVVHSILQARRSRYVSEVVVSTDDVAIASIAKSFRATVVPRPKKLASATASSESVLIHALDYLKAWERLQYLVFLQPTSPVRRKDDIDNAIETLKRQRADSLFSACSDRGLIWALKDNKPIPLNYNYKNRKMEQQWDGQFRENGSIYVTRPEILSSQKNRLGGKIAIYEMDLLTSFQVDRPEDLEFMEWIMTRHKELRSHLKAEY